MDFGLVLQQNNNSLGTNEPIKGNVSQIKKFIEALKSSKSKLIRIAHFGDSLIQGDVISEYLRELFQEKYSGFGIGFLPITATDIKMRQTIKHDFSSDWNMASVISRNLEKHPVGISGSVWIPQKNSWVKYETTPFLNSSKYFQIVNLYYSHADPSSIIEYSINGASPIQKKLEPGNELKRITIDTKKKSTSFYLKFISGKEPYFYGISLESESGLLLDNFSLPGNPGASLLEIPDNILKSFASTNNYNLILLNYGAGILSANIGMYKVFESKMIKLIEKFNNIFPDASIVLITIPDVGMKNGNNIVTHPEVQKLINVQEQIAIKTGIMYWNLFEAMGGTNSMIRWVNNKPPFAFVDYMHFTPSGGKRVAQLFFNSFLELYNDAN